MNLHSTHTLIMFDKINKIITLNSFLCKNAFFLYLMCSCFFLCSCARKDSFVVDGSKKNLVAVSIVPQEHFLEKICADNCAFITAIPPGYSPANYEPSPLEIKKLQQAKIFFAIGIPAEKAILKRIPKATKIVHLERAVSRLYDDRHFELGRDPHIWLSPKRVRVMVQQMCDELSLLYPEYKSFFKENSALYCEELIDLEKSIKEKIFVNDAGAFIVFHPSFGYFADDFGLKMYSIEENGKEASAQHLMNLIDFAKTHTIHTVFYQSEIDSVQSKAFAEEIKGQAVSLSPLSKDYEGNLRKIADLIGTSTKVKKAHE